MRTEPRFSAITAPAVAVATGVDFWASAFAPSARPSRRRTSRILEVISISIGFSEPIKWIMEVLFAQGVMSLLDAKQRGPAQERDGLRTNRFEVAMRGRHAPDFHAFARPGALDGAQHQHLGRLRQQAPVGKADIGERELNRRFPAAEALGALQRAVEFEIRFVEL